jgi:SPP1 gp7 family putative phage head morphogenesis protein
MAIHFAKAERPRRIPLSPEEQALARSLFNAIKNATDKISLTELERLMRNLDPQQVTRLVEAITIANQKNVQDSLLNAIELGGREAIEQIRKLAPKLALPQTSLTPPKITNKKPMANLKPEPLPTWAKPKQPKLVVNMKFNVTNPLALKFAETRAGQLITSIDALTRAAVRQAIIDAFNDQIDVRATAKRIKNVVGLHPQWGKAVTEFERKEFARLVRQGDKPERALTKAQERASRYADSLKSKRATMIARTEIQLAQNEGRYEGWKQASEEGFVDPQSMKMWVTAKDERTCEICAPMDGETVPWNGLFSIGVEAPIVHPNCRCAMVLLPPERS